MPTNPVKIKKYIDLIPKDFAISIAFSPDGKYLAAGTEKDGVLIYNDSITYHCTTDYRRNNVVFFYMANHLSDNKE